MPIACSVGIKSVCYYEKSAPKGVLDGVRKECERGKNDMRIARLQYTNGRFAICEW